MAVDQFTVRPATVADCESIARVHVASIRSLGASDYPVEVIDAWAAFRTGEVYVAAMEQGVLFFVAIADTSDGCEQIAGFSSYSFVSGKHRTAIYVDGPFARQGVGKALFTAAQNEARKHHAEQIDVDASVGAVPFYQALGFESLGIGEHRLRSGRKMACVFMRKRL